MSQGLVRKLLILSVGVLLVLVGILYQVKQNAAPKIHDTSPVKDMASVMTASLQQQRRYFQRCWLRSNTVVASPDPENASTQLTWQIFLVIEPTGKVKDFSLLNKAMFDAETEKCLREISFRLKFPSFEGDDISISAPIVISNIQEK